MFPTLLRLPAIKTTLLPIMGCYSDEFSFSVFLFLDSGDISFQRCSLITDVMVALFNFQILSELTKEGFFSVAKRVRYLHLPYYVVTLIQSLSYLIPVKV